MARWIVGDPMRQIMLFIAGLVFVTACGKSEKQSSPDDESKKAITSTAAPKVESDAEVRAAIEQLCKHPYDETAHKKGRETLVTKGDKAVLDLSSAYASRKGTDKAATDCRAAVLKVLAESGSRGLSAMLSGINDPDKFVQFSVCADVNSHAAKFHEDKRLKAAAIDALASVKPADSEIKKMCDSARKAVLAGVPQ